MDHIAAKLPKLVIDQHLPTRSTKSDSAWVLTRIQMLMSGYRRADYHDPEGFIVTMGAILEDFDPAIVEFVTSPKTGIQRSCKWPPTTAEVVEACTEATYFLQKHGRLWG